MLELFGDIPGFLYVHVIGSFGAAPKTYEELQELLLTKSCMLVFELAIMADIRELFITATSIGRRWTPCTQLL